MKGVPVRWSDEERQRMSQQHKARLAALTPEERMARTAAARRGARLAHAWRRELKAAELLRDAGWEVTPPTAATREDAGIP